MAARIPNLDKAGARGLFVAESLSAAGGGPAPAGGAKTAARGRASVLAGVVMRRDLVIDGFVLGHATVGGDDAAEQIAAMHARLGRADIGIIVVSGAVISSYNVVDLQRLRDRTGVPAVAVSYDEPADGAGGGGGPRAALFAGLGPRARVRLRTSHDLYVRCAGCRPEQAGRLLDSMTVQGSIPEPLRIARLLARAAGRAPSGLNG